MNKKTISRYCPFQNIEYLLTLSENLEENLDFLIFHNIYLAVFMRSLYRTFKMWCVAYDLYTCSTSPN
jgi:hypothetical protein